jgi:hypothetical protein
VAARRAAGQSGGVAHFPDPSHTVPAPGPGERHSNVLFTSQQVFSVALSAAPAGIRALDSALLRRALRSPSCRERFRDIPVDWFDRGAGTWRPTAIAQPGTHGPSVDLFVPLDEGIAMAPAPIADLRLGRGQSDAVMRFWTIRYRLRLLRVLAAGLGGGETAALDLAAGELSGAESEMRDVWLTAYAHGIPPRARHTLLRPSHVRLAWSGRFEQHAMTGRCPTGPGGLLDAALDLYGTELARIRRALLESGLDAAEIERHPFPTALRVLLASAATELLRCAPVDGVLALDPKVWSA